MSGRIICHLPQYAYGKNVCQDSECDKGILGIYIYCTGAVPMLQTVSHVTSSPWPKHPDRYSAKAANVFSLPSITESSGRNLHSFAVHSFRSHNVHCLSSALDYKNGKLHIKYTPGSNTWKTSVSLFLIEGTFLYVFVGIYKYLSYPSLNNGNN
jgi:hypothetical protein